MRFLLVAEIAVNDCEIDLERKEVEGGEAVNRGQRLRVMAAMQVI